jgi:predicted GH43/DUF377 family glycosyl hydrolase
MKRAFYICLVLIPFLSVAQQKGKSTKLTSNKTENDIFAKHSKCYFHNKYSVQQRKNFYPFSTASEVKLIGFRANGDKIILENGEEDTIVSNAGKKPMYVRTSSNYYELNQGRLHSTIKLSAQGIDSLTDLLYNYGYTPVKLPSNVNVIDEPTGCYEPRNAILFIDTNGKVKEYIEFCFTCEQASWSSRKIRDITFCVDKYAMLKRFFFKNGIPYD